MCVGLWPLALLICTGFRLQAEIPCMGLWRAISGGESIFFRVRLRLFWLSHKPCTSYPQALTSVMLRIYRGIDLWITCVCLWTKKHGSISSSWTGHASRVSRPFTASPSKKHVRPGAQNTRSASRACSVFRFMASLETLPKFARPAAASADSDLRRNAALVNSAKGQRPTHIVYRTSKHYLHILWVVVGKSG